MTITFVQLFSIIGVGLSFGFILANLFANRRFSIIAFLIFLIVGALYVVKYYLIGWYGTYFAAIPNVETYFLIASGLTFVVSFASFVITNGKTNVNALLFKYAVGYENTNVLAYVSKTHKILQASKKMEDILNYKTKGKQFALNVAVMDDEKLDLKKLEKSLAHCGGKLNEVVYFYFTFSNALMLELEVIKKKVMKGRRCVGYVLIDHTVSNSYKIEVQKEFKKNLYIYLDLFNAPVAYFDSEDKKYIVSHVLMDMVGFESNQINQEDFVKMMHPSDVQLYQARKIEENILNKVHYRLQTTNGYVWFEEGFARYFGRDFILMKRTEMAGTSRVVFGNYKSMLNRVVGLCTDKTSFGLILMNITNITQISAAMGKEFGDILLSKFFTKVLTGSLKDQIQMFKLGSTEYGLVVENAEYMQLVVRNLHNNTSELLSQDIVINKTNYRIECELGIVSSLDFEKCDAREIMKAAFDTLKEASDPDFLKDYSIYQPKQLVEVDYNLERLGINPDEDDLSQFEEDVKK